MYVFDGLFILLLVFNTNDTDIKRKNRLIYFTRSNSTTVTSELIFPPSLRLQFDYYPLNSTIKILYAFLICPVRVPRPPPQIIIRDSMITIIFCENYELGTSVL